MATKVVVQMVCKLGGEPWAVEIPMKDTMVIGYDTYHDSAQKGRSAGALVASLNKTFTKYISVANLHTTPHQELNDNLVPALTRALRKYQEVNGQLPVRIILYRDGVGDGQINYVLEHEVAAIERCFTEAGMDQLKFTYIIVSKRINTRFFRQALDKKATNPPSGTVVDNTVTLPERWVAWPSLPLTNHPPLVASGQLSISPPSGTTSSWSPSRCGRAPSTPPATT